MNRVFAALVRVSAFVRKEVAEVVRQPRLLLTLIIGPFGILLLFGAGLRDVDPPVETLFVAPDDEELAAEVHKFAAEQEEQDGRALVQGVIRDEETALRRLRAGNVDMVLVFPDDAEETIRNNEHPVITLHHNQMDPIESRALILYLQHAIDQLNQQLVERVVEEGQADSEELEQQIAETRERVDSARRAAARDDRATAAVELERLRGNTAVLALALGPAAAIAGGAEGDAGLDGEADEDESLHAAVARFNERLDTIDDTDDLEREGDDLDNDLAAMEEALTEFRSLSPEVLAAPFHGEVKRITGNTVEMSDFYAPAVLVVLLQHLIVTFVSLSFVREQELGTTELYQVAPLRVGEIVIGKYVAYTVLATLVGAILTAALVLLLGVPLHGSVLAVALILLAVILASCGLGLCVAVVSDNDGQAVQYTMLVLLTTVFFSGFLLSLERFLQPFSWIGYLVPASYGVELLRASMLGGVFRQPELLAVLGVYALVLGVVGWLGVSRRFRHA